MSLSIAFISSRRDNKFDWFLASLARQSAEILDIIYVDFFYGSDGRHDETLRQIKPFHDMFHFTITAPKPTVWQGPHRLTKEDWWAKSSALNVAIILCETDWISFVDDRCVLSDGWLGCVKDAMTGNYAVCGSYEKRYNMRVENGVIIDAGELAGADQRPQRDAPQPTRDWYGGSGALPLEWCLAVNGFSEDLCDGLGSEDSQFGVCLRNSAYPMRYDSRMRLIEDRTPGQIDGALKRADKGEGRAAKSWDIVRAFHGKKTSQNSFDIRNVRDRVLLNHEPLESIGPFGSDRDWYDNQLLSEME